MNRKIAESFGSSVTDYNEHATVQKEVANRLIASLKPWRDILPPGPILEVGCGTGFVTNGIVDLYPKREKVITDLSEEMVDFCRDRFQSAKNISFQQLDAEQLQTEEPKYGMTVCGFAAQWFKDPALTLGKLMEATRPGGLLLASFPGNESFPEWKKCCEDLGLPFTGNDLPDTEEIVIKMSTGPVQVDYYEDTVTESYPSALHFFRHLKNIGAGTHRKGRSLTPSEMKMLIRHWDSQNEEDITVSYHVVFLAVKRDHVS
ncbi:methyltransferase domain-containing protein [Balneolaceae bacterium YR4-1]|uniref:Methyltransferase domain-containing protein n=2 Tax=Halalkalibaculum roseum TaxID=2709311 RepID=A0A6M1STT5_9BACT|nr:methyltransferase domain-containing protein [Halalkalibaculum roseum]